MLESNSPTDNILVQYITNPNIKTQVQGKRQAFAKSELLQKSERLQKASSCKKRALAKSGLLQKAGSCKKQYGSGDIVFCNAIDICTLNVRACFFRCACFLLAL